MAKNEKGVELEKEAPAENPMEAFSGEGGRLPDTHRDNGFRDRLSFYEACRGGRGFYDRQQYLYHPSLLFLRTDLGQGQLGKNLRGWVHPGPDNRLEMRK